MKRFFAGLLTLALVSLLCMTVCAGNTLPIQMTGTSDTQKVVDSAYLLTESEEARLEELAREISQRQQCDVVILTENGLGGKSPMAYADDYFDYNGYGYGADRTGILLLLDMQERDWWISTCGAAIQAFTDDGIQYLWSKCASRISDGSYADGFEAFLETADEMLSAYNGTLSDEDYEIYQEDFESFAGTGSRTSSKPDIVKTTVFALVLGLVLAFVPAALLKSQLKSVRSNYSAGNYRRANSMHLDRTRDIYLYANTTSRVIETQRSSSGGGGSSVHISSSGTSHGGGGGKF